MKYFQVVYKDISEQAGGIIVRNNVFEARSYRVNECGVLTLRDEENEPIKSFPPGSWLSIERVVKDDTKSLLAP